MRRHLGIVLMMHCLVMATFIMIGCSVPGTVRAEPLLPVVERLVDRHDAYTDADTTLSPLQTRANKRDGVLVLKALNTALEEEKEDTDEE